tara:strand:+ start:343 stop:1482 length:1140 start_codon:yes stop_codon:yes gene_type:complete
MIKIIQLKVILYAIINKIKKLLNSKYDPYYPLDNNFNLNPSNIIIEKYKNPPLLLSYSKKKVSPLKWQSLARKKLSELSGYDDNRKKPSILKKFKEEKISKNIYKKKVYLEILSKTIIPLNLIYKKPIKNNRKVFIFLAGSTSGVHIGWGEAKVPIDHQRIFIGADIAKQAAEKGYLAITIEQAGYGERLERKLPKQTNNRTIDFANHLLLLGKSLIGNGATEISSVIDWLCSKNNILNIDRNNIFLYGHSSGGTLAQFAAALDKRIKGTLASGSVGPIRQTIGARGCGSGDGIVPGFLKWFDTKDVISLISPRLFIALSGDKDHIYPYSGAKQVVNDAKAIYTKLNAEDKIICIKVNGKHQYYNKESWEVLDKYMALK